MSALEKMIKAVRSLGAASGENFLLELELKQNRFKLEFLEDQKEMSSEVLKELDEVRTFFSKLMSQWNELEKRMKVLLISIREAYPGCKEEVAEFIRQHPGLSQEEILSEMIRDLPGVEMTFEEWENFDIPEKWKGVFHNGESMN